MDCGPACLTAFLGGFGIDANYGRLREACHTDIDGTSIDTVEEAAQLLGLDAEQIMLPADHLFIDEAAALPAIAVVRLPNGATHFLILWSRHGRFVQVMDPGGGRQWRTTAQIAKEMYIHTAVVPADAWREWTASEEFVRAFLRRLANLGIGTAAAQSIVEEAHCDATWHSIAAADAACRLVQSMLDSGALKKGNEAEHIFRALATAAREDEDAVAELFWSVRPKGEGQLAFKGVVLVRGRGVKASPKTDDLPHDLRAALEEPQPRPLSGVFRMLREDGMLGISALLSVWVITAFVLLIQAVMLRGLITLAGEIGSRRQLLAGGVALITVALALAVQRAGSALAIIRYGRIVENRVRVLFGDKVLRLEDRYFQSRLIGDMAERAHSIYLLRLLSSTVSRIITSLLELVLMVAGIIWLDPRQAPLAITAGLLSIGIPLLAQPALIERDLRARTHFGALARHYLDSMLGLTAIRAHSAERPIRGEQERLLVEWSRAAIAFLRTSVLTDAAQLASVTALAAWMLFRHIDGRTDYSGSLLLTYWALTLPFLGSFFASSLRSYPMTRNILRRILEPLGAPEIPESSDGADDFDGTGGTDGTDAAQVDSDGPIRPIVPPKATGVAIALRNVTVTPAGHSILRNLDLTIAPGEHVGIVGSSGAGKSTLIGLLLGWQTATSGEILVGGSPLDDIALERLRRVTAWVDPAIQLWNRPLLDNITYGSAPAARPPLDTLLRRSDLLDVLGRMRDGLQQHVGESGRLLSGGEGQRVRIARALARPNARLVLLDEAFRGLDRRKRRQLLEEARKHWAHATLLCVTHDIDDTTVLDRVIVMKHGAIIEQGAPATLLANADSAYAALLADHKRVETALWTRGWRRVRIEEGQLHEQ